MKEYTSVEDQLERLGKALRARPRLTNRVMNEIRASAVDASTKAASTLAPLAVRRHRQLIAVVTGSIAVISAAVLITIMLFPSPSVGWADVTKAVQSQKWIRGTVTFTNGESGTMWLSPEQQIWAFKLGGSTYFYNGPEQVKYELRAGDKSITKLPLGEDDAEKVLSMNAFSQGKSAIGHWLFGTEKVVSQERKDVSEAGKNWIEFQLTLWRGEMNRATLRVDPETRLPVYLLLTSPKDTKESIKWQFDYPVDGPTDIYALSVPRATTIDDRVPSSDALSVLRAIAKTREQIGDFRLLVAQYPPTNHIGSIVWRKGDRWRVDDYGTDGDVDLSAEAQNDRNWTKRFEERLKNRKSIPLYVCNGRTVWENSTLQPGAKPQWQVSRHTGPQDLMSGDGLSHLSGSPYVKIASLLFPDLSPKPGWPFEFDAEPSDAPGCVLVKRSARLATAEPLVGHEWYYVDPAKGHAVVRAELFNLPADVKSAPENSQTRQTIRMENFHQSRHGFWYPTVVQDTMPIMPAIPGNNQQGNGPLRQLKRTIRYHFDFDVELPDSLFTVDGPQVPKQ